MGRASHSARHTRFLFSATTASSTLPMRWFPETSAPSARAAFRIAATVSLCPGRMRFSPVLRLASGAHFTLGLGGADRNLDAVGNDRPIFNGDTKVLKWR